MNVLRLILYNRLCYAIFCHEVKAAERSPPRNLTQWIITQSKGFTKKALKR